MTKPYYTIHTNSIAEARETVSAGDIAARIDELSGRSIAGYILGQRGPVRRTGGAFVSGARGFESFVVREVSDRAEGMRR